jgi:hypothetical protein
MADLRLPAQPVVHHQRRPGILGTRRAHVEHARRLPGRQREDRAVHGLGRAASPEGNDLHFSHSK